MSTPLRNLPVAVIDFEATDYPSPDTHVCDVAVVHATLGADDARVAFASLVRPPISIPDRVSRIHGIDDARVADAPPFAEIADRMIEAIGDRPIVAFNAPADFTFAAVELARMGRPALRWPWIDLFVVRKATKTRGRPGKLSEIAGEHGIVLDAHGATGDALTTALLLTPLMRAAWNAGAFASRYGAQPSAPWRHGSDHAEDWDDDEDDLSEPERVETLEAFFSWQREAALWQEQNFTDWLRRSTGGTGQRPQCGWHEREGVELPFWPETIRSAPCPSCGGATVRRVGKDGATYLANAGTDVAHECPQATHA
jgi:DNA polymerase III epsilon subunit-like protein